jgi:LysM repeat protein
MNKLVISFLLILGCYCKTVAQDLTPEEYINQYKDLAINEMKRMGIPAAITLAQGLLESQNGNSDLVKSSNNHFGIKCKSSWTAETVNHDDDERGECFRKYGTAEDSYRDHSNFLRGNSRYDFLFKLNPADYKAWAYGLRKAGYATNPRYPDILIKNIEKYNLEQYTLAAIDEVPHFDASKYSDDPVNNAVVSKQEQEEDSDFTVPRNLRINGLKALYVPKGTSLLAIASENHINLEKLLAINELKKDGLLGKAQYIFLEKKQKEGNIDFCFAEAGETMYDIAQRNGIMLQNLYDYNQITSDGYLSKGTQIFLRPGMISDETNNVPQAQTASIKISMHEVLPKENLYSISKKYGVTVDQLKSWNNLTSDGLQVGQQLIVSK